MERGSERGKDGGEKTVIPCKGRKIKRKDDGQIRNRGKEMWEEKA